MTITLSEYMEQGSVWGGILALGPLPFPADPAQLDLMLGLDYGDRWMFTKLVTQPIATVSANIRALYLDSWTKQVEVLALDYELGASNTKKTTETINRTEERTNSRDDVKKVSAFNTEELITDEGNTTTGADDLTGDTTRVLTESNLSLKDAFNNLSLLDQANILKTVNKDVSTYLTLSVY